ncbi:MAG: type II toxin-antitoxin system ParD family antitoxin [Caulobacterales bacterium]
MKTSGKISVALSAAQLRHVRRLVEAGEFTSAGAVVREALKSWLHRKGEDARRHALIEARIRRTFGASRAEAPHAETFERVELMFDAGDAKA